MCFLVMEVIASAPWWEMGCQLRGDTGGGSHLEVNWGDWDG